MENAPTTSQPTDFRAIIYCRVSDKQQVTEGHGLEGQEQVCKQRCENQSPAIQVEKVYKEPGVSGSVMNRKELNNALAYLKEQNKIYSHITHFVVSEASRISRPDDIAEAFTLEEQIKARGVTIIKVDSPGLDESTDEGMLFKTIQYAIARYEKQKFVQRSNNGRRNRLLQGYRPFWTPPVGYLREKLSKKDYVDQIDEKKGPIIKRGLEMFAQDVFNSQMDLRRYRSDQGLRTNDKNSKTLQKTFVDKTLQLHRLFYYAGYLIYPNRGVNEPIDAKHEALISLTTVNQIINKLQSNHNKGKSVKNNAFKLSDEHPLRGVITCPECGRKYTSRNTSKMVGKGSAKTKKLYPYYGCNTRNCSERVNIKKEKLEGIFEALLKKLHLTKNIVKLIDAQFGKTRDDYLGSKENRKAIKRKEIQTLMSQQKTIELSLIKTSNPKLYQSLEEQWASLDAEIGEIEDALKNDTAIQYRTKSLLLKSRLIFEDPLAVRKLGNQEMRKLLLTVRFGDHLYFSKSHGLQTANNGSLFSILVGSGVGNSIFLPIWHTYQTDPEKFYEKLYTFLDLNAPKIDVLYEQARALGRIHTDGKNNEQIKLPKKRQ